MATIFDVAKYILEKCGRMSTWKLQKLCYYSQAWALAWEGEPLFNEDFEAWSNGPVCPELFREHQGKYSVGIADLKVGNSDALTANEKDDIDVVLKDYGNMEAYDLRAQTHMEAPWINARHGIPEGQRGHEKIGKGAMGEYYGSL